MRPANRVPSEVLASCASFVSDADPRPIIPLTHVCRYWRRSIGSSPRNWTSIGMEWGKLVPLCLERAGALPLVVDIVVPDSKRDEALLNALLPHVSKIGSLRLTGYPSIETVAEDLPGFFASPILGLTSLELQQTADPAQPFPPNNFPVPPPFLDVSKLKLLTLTRTPLYPTLFTITSLVELKLIGYTTPLHFGTFLGLLVSNSDLELVVLDVQFLRDSVEAAPAKMVPLSRLRHLSITCANAIDSRVLLSRIPLPRGVRVEVVSTQSDQRVKLRSFLPSPPTPIQDLLAPITTIKTQATPQELQVFGNGSVSTFRSMGGLLNAHPESRLFSCTAVRDFHTDTYPATYSDASLPRVLGRLPRLETLAFPRTPFHAGLLTALTEEPALCPALRTIAFFDSGVDSEVMEKLGEAIIKRWDLMAVRLHRVVVVDSAGTLPDLRSRVDSTAQEVCPVRRGQGGRQAPGFIAVT